MNKKYFLDEHPVLKYKRINPTPSKEEIEHYYKQEFYSGEYKRFNDSELIVQEADKEFFESIWNRIIENLQILTADSVKGKTILDIGCGWGLALKYYEGLGLKCFGLDPSPEAVEYSIKNGLNVKLSGIEYINYHNEKKYNFISLMNVLEHIGSPEIYLKKIVENLMTEETILVIDVPNDFNCLQIAGRNSLNLNNWWIAPPQHLNYFNLKSLTNVIEYCGMEVIYAHSSFPLEIFLLMGENYVSEASIGRDIHKKRCKFEKNMQAYDGGVKLRELYENFANIGIGRQLTVYARRVIQL